MLRTQDKRKMLGTQEMMLVKQDETTNAIREESKKTREVFCWTY